MPPIYLCFIFSCYLYLYFYEVILFCTRNPSFKLFLQIARIGSVFWIPSGHIPLIPKQLAAITLGTELFVRSRQFQRGIESISCSSPVLFSIKPRRKTAIIKKEGNDSLQTVTKKKEEEEEAEEKMCYKVLCKQCGKYTWGGCGDHLKAIYPTIEKGKHCTCRPWPGVVVPSETAAKPPASTATASASSGTLLWSPRIIFRHPNTQHCLLHL